MAEREVAVPRVGTITALPTFRVLASMNPFDNVGTARISDSVYDRWCRLAVGYQDAAEEADIVAGAHRVDRRPAGHRRGRDHPGHPRPRRAAPRVERARGDRHWSRSPSSWRRSARYDADVRAPGARRRAARAVRADRRGRGAARSAPEQVITGDLGEPFFLLPRRAAPGPHRLNIDNAVALPTASGGDRRLGAAAPQAQAARRGAVGVPAGRRDRRSWSISGPSAGTATPTARRRAARASC